MKALNLLFLFLPLIMCSCETLSESSSYLPNTFTTENIMSVRQGMTSEKIAELFGAPKSINTSVCGAGVGEKWNCTTWKYGEFPYDEASFIFNVQSSGAMILNSFDIKRR